MINPLEGLQFKVTTLDIDDRRFGTVPLEELTSVHREEIVDERPGELLLKALEDSRNVAAGNETWLSLKDIDFYRANLGILRYEPIPASLKDVHSRCLAQWRTKEPSAKTLLSESDVLRRRVNILADWFLTGRHDRNEAYLKIERALRSSAILLPFFVVFVSLC